MFEYTALHWGTFIAAAALLILSPGPTMAFILEQTARHGKSSGFAAMFGIWSGAFVHVVLAAAGLSAILASSATAFLAVKWLGALYLLFLGIQALLSKGTTHTATSPEQVTSNRTVYMQGMLIAALNPKGALFFLAFYLSLWSTVPARLAHNCFCMASSSLPLLHYLNHHWFFSALHSHEP